MDNNKILLSAVLALAASHTSPQGAEYAPVAPDVPYSVAAKLPYESASDTLSYGEDPLQFAKVWRPGTPMPAGGYPVVIFIHGGCWLNQFDMTHAYPLMSGLQQKGFAVIGVEYRRTGDEGGGWPGSFDDIITSLRFLRENPPAQLNLNQAVLSGHSAGGHLGMLAGGLAESSWLKGVIGLAAITDIVAYGQGDNSCQKATAAFMGGTLAEKPAAYRQANPQHQARHPRTFLLQGGKDKIVPRAQAARTGLPMSELPDAGHFDYLHPGSEAFARFVARIEEMLKS